MKWHKGGKEMSNGCPWRRLAVSGEKRGKEVAARASKYACLYGIGKYHPTPLTSEVLFCPLKKYLAPNVQFCSIKLPIKHFPERKSSTQIK